MLMMYLVEYIISGNLGCEFFHEFSDALRFYGKLSQTAEVTSAKLLNPHGAVIRRYKTDGRSDNL